MRKSEKTLNYDNEGKIPKINTNTQNRKAKWWKQRKSEGKISPVGVNFSRIFLCSGFKWKQINCSDL